MDRTALEQKLGPPADFILTVDNRHLVTQWAIAAGYPAVEVHAMTPVALANLYHVQGGSNRPTDTQRLASEMLLQALAVFRDAVVTPENVRRLVYDAIGDEACREAIRAHVGDMATRLEITVTAAPVVTIENPHYMTADVIATAALGDPIMLVGPAGCGKTTIGEHVAQALALPFYITNAINETHELTGFIDGHGVYHATSFRYAYENGGVWIADEIDAWDASALLAANSALANGFTSFPDVPAPVRRHPNFRMIATANTYGNGGDRIYVGRTELDGASLDRFAFIDIDYDLTLERMFAAGQDRWLEHVWKIRKAVQAKRIRHVVSSRSVARGANALRNGMEWRKVEERYLFKGMSESDRSKVK